VGRSSTTFSGKWRQGKTTVVRVPQVLAARVIEYARKLDSGSPAKDPSGVYRTAEHFSFDQPVNVASVPQLSPFRYPGGKTWLVPYVRTWLRGQKKKPAVLVEPFAGGGIIGLTAGLEKLVDHVVFVEKDIDVASVWRVMLGGQAEWLANRIENFELTKANVLAVLGNGHDSQRERAFVTILRNRVQRGGIMAQGAGFVKNGENGRGLHSRWYPQTLAKRIRSIAALRERFTFIMGDGLEIIKAYADDADAVFFADPPYTVAARRLYTNWQVDHRRLFAALKSVKGNVLLTYDNTKEITLLAEEFGFETQAITMKNTHHARMSELLVGKNLSWLRHARASFLSTARTAQAKLAFHP
jgi:DNA adenine methylase